MPSEPGIVLQDHNGVLDKAIHATRKQCKTCVRLQASQNTESWSSMDGTCRPRLLYTDRRDGRKGQGLEVPHIELLLSVQVKVTSGAKLVQVQLAATKLSARTRHIYRFVLTFRGSRSRPPAAPAEG